MGEGEYVIGLKPCNCYVGGQVDSQNSDILKYLEPEETRDFDLTVELLSGLSEIDLAITKINNYNNLL